MSIERAIEILGIELPAEVRSRLVVHDEHADLFSSDPFVIARVIRPQGFEKILIGRMKIAHNREARRWLVEQLEVVRSAIKTNTADKLWNGYLVRADGRLDFLVNTQTGQSSVCFFSDTSESGSRAKGPLRR